MAYAKVNWANGEAGGKKMNATNFGTMDNGIAANDSAIGDLSTLNTTAKDNLVGAINENVSKIGDLSALNTTVKDNLVSSVNEVVENVAKGNFTISKSGDWTIKKYDNGYVEMWLDVVANRTTSIFGNTPIYFGTCNFTYPIELIDIPINVNAISAKVSTLTGMSINEITKTYISMFLLSFGAAISNAPVRTYLYVLGRWKEEVVNNE